MWHADSDATNSASGSAFALVPAPLRRARAADPSGRRPPRCARAGRPCRPPSSTSAAWTVMPPRASLRRAARAPPRRSQAPGRRPPSSPAAWRSARRCTWPDRRSAGRSCPRAHADLDPPSTSEPRPPSPTGCGRSPITPRLSAPGPPRVQRVDHPRYQAARLGLDAAEHAHDHVRTCSSRPLDRTPMSSNGVQARPHGRCRRSRARLLHPPLPHHREELDDLLEGIREHRRQYELLAGSPSTSASSSTHVEGGDLALHLAQVRLTLLKAHAERAGREVDDRLVADLRRRSRSACSP